MRLARCRGVKGDGFRCRKFGPGDYSTFWLCPLHEKQPGDPEWKLPLTLGHLAADFIEDLCVHGPGDVQGERVHLTAEELQFIYELYELDPDVGALLRYLAVLSRAKGFRKTELLGWLGCFEMLGPCRADLKDGAPALDSSGRLVGVPVQSARVGSVATEEGQAAQSLEVGLFVCRESLSKHYQLDVLVDEIRVEGGSKWELFTSTSRSKDGAKSTALLLDEPHLWTTPGLHRLYQMVIRQLSKRTSGGLAIAATTAWRPGSNSVAEAAYKTFLSDPGGGVLFDMRMAPEGLDVGKKSDVMRGLKYAYGDADWVPLDRIYRNEFKPIGADPLKTEAEARRYFFNQPTAPEDRFLPDMKVWRDLALPQEVPDGARVVLAFDGSISGDSTQLVGLWLKEGRPYLFSVGSWERPTELEHFEVWRVDRQSVKDTVASAVERWHVAALVVDSAFWESTVADWARSSLTVVEFNFRSAPQTGRAFKLLLEMISEGELEHDGSEVLDRHLSNAVRKDRGQKDQDGNGHLSISKVDPHSDQWIDAAVCCGLAVWGADNFAEGEAEEYWDAVY